jgi:hypothetical protein
VDRTLLALVVLSAVCAGCSGGAAASGDDVVPEGAFEEVPVQATDDTGVVRGIVVDEAIRPVAGAKVTLPVMGDKARSATTAETGVFAFDGLRPGTYFIQATKPGYMGAQQSVDVVAGVAAPEPVKILLQSDPGSLPYVEQYKLDGFMQCGGVFVVVTFSAPCTTLIGDEDARGADYNYTANLTWAQSEMVWEANTQLADRFELVFGRHSFTGTSPLTVSANATAWGEGADEGGETSVFVWPMGMEGSNVGGLWGVGLVLQQEFQIFTFFFHNHQPPTGWTFVNDGDPPLP